MAKLPAVATPNGGVGELIQVERWRGAKLDAVAGGVEADVRIEPGLVGDYNLIVGRDNDVELQHIDPEGEGVQKGRQSVFRPQAATATVAVDFQTRGK